MLSQDSTLNTYWHTFNERSSGSARISVVGASVKKRRNEPQRAKRAGKKLS